MGRRERAAPTRSQIDSLQTRAENHHGAASPCQPAALALASASSSTAGGPGAAVRVAPLPPALLPLVTETTLLFFGAFYDQYSKLEFCKTKNEREQSSNNNNKRQRCSN
ncbi:hypothetical protein F2P81_022020 [Scophthalmus maximus]|uniref:Uncharacterized protein n=1 Tax=Scophthalmus maximus TaxID=52904 RepID=A0A6A4RXT5_SCOMX|nr:hypothetical protein F2P81_022020 [Scophthalmus maximus]